MSGGQAAVLYQGHQVLGQIQQPQGVGHGGAGFSHALGHLLLGQAVLRHQGLIPPGLLGGIQVLPLEIFDQTQLHDLPVVRFNDNGGDLVQSGLLGRPPPALAGMIW